jgi:hypothetical protein
MGLCADFFFWFDADAVSEHAFALAAALTRRILPMHRMTVGGERWKVERPIGIFGRAPRVNSEETLVSLMVCFWGWVVVLTKRFAVRTKLLFGSI